MSMDEPILSPEELAALSKQSRPKAPPEDFAAVADAEEQAAAYDLTNEDRPVRGHLPALDLLHIRLANDLALTLERALGTPVEVQSEDTQLTKLGTVLEQLKGPACICLLEIESLGESAMLNIDPSLVLALMTRFYGGGESADEDEAGADIRPLTTVEQGFARFIASRFCLSMTEVWRDIADVPTTVTSVEVSSRFAAITPPGDVMVTAGFSVTAGAVSGHMQFVVPYAGLRPFHRVLQSSVQQGQNQRRLSWHEQIRTLLDNVPLSLMGELGQTNVSMQRLASLSKDDVLTLDTDRGSPVAIYVEGARKFAGRLTVVGGNIAIRIEAEKGGADDEIAAPHPAFHQYDTASLAEQEIAR